MRLNHLIILGLLIICNSILAQTIEWERTFSLPNDQRLVSVVEADSGFFGYGQGEDPTDFNELLKMDSSGNLLWRKPLGIGPITSVSGDMVKVPEEFSYYLSGFYSQSGFGNDFITKIDTRGDTIWVYRYSLSGIYQTWYKIIALQDKSVLSVGYQQQAGTNEDVFVRRLDSLGNLLWDNIYPMPGNQRAYDITEMLDGSLLVSGISDGAYLILRIGFDGNLISNKTYSSVTNITDTRIRLTHLNTAIQSGSSISLNNNLENLLTFFDSSYLTFQILPINTWSMLYDNDSNLAVCYFDGSDVRIRYTNSNILGNIWDISLGSVTNSFKYPESFFKSKDGSFLICGVANQQGNPNNYWLAKISGVGEEWVPDRCSYQPPIAGFDYEYNYPVLTLRDTSSGGLKYLDTVYTWQWNTSVGTNGTDDSLVVFFDTAFTKTIDIELVIGNWYGCTDTVNQTLVLGETGLEVYRELEVKVFPNPVKDILNVHIDDIQDRVLFSLYDLQGRLQFNQVLHKDKTSISLSGLPQGLYIYDIRSDGQTIPLANGRGKIVKN